MNPCLPHVHTAATLRAWAVWRHAHPLWQAKVVVPACVRAGALAIPLAIPGAAFLPPVPHGGVVFGGPVLSGPAYAPYAAGYGSLFVPGVYAPLSLPGVVPSPAAVLAGGILAEAGETTAAVGESPTLTPMLSGDIPHWLPERAGAGQGVPTEVPEPSSVAVLCAGLVALVVRRWVR